MTRIHFQEASFVVAWLEQLPSAINNPTTAKSTGAGFSLDSNDNSQYQPEIESKDLEHDPNQSLLPLLDSPATPECSSDDVIPSSSSNHNLHEIDITCDEVDCNVKIPWGRTPLFGPDDATTISSTPQSQLSNQSYPYKLPLQPFLYSTAPLERSPTDLRGPDPPQELVNPIVETQPIRER